MPRKPDFDLSAAHRYFSADCFNKVWELLDKDERTAEDDEEMLRLAFASCWHWTQRPDCSETNLSIANWQIARVYAVLGQAENSRRYALRCLAVSQSEEVLPFYLAYAYEALARAELVAGNQVKMRQYIEKARQIAGEMTDPESRELLLKDLENLK